jgi:carboxyl-terminal processing protease
VKKSYYSQISPSDNDEKALQVVTKMTKSLGDKYSRILDSNQYLAIQKYDLIGIGATLMPDQQKHIIVGAPPVPGSASDRAGLKVGDYIAAVNGVPTDGRSAFDIIDQISDDPNAKTITMTVKREGNEGQQGFTKDITMERAFAEVRNPIQFKVSETRKDGTKVGYVRIVEFNGIVKAKLEEAIHSLEKDGVNAYVIDVRGNPGGAFQSAVEISSLFLDDRIATYVIDSNQAKLPFRTASGSVLVDSKDPIAIWIDRNSASASEVFTGSLHDNCRAVVMGENSFGKGKIQAVYGLKDGAGLVLTVAKYVTPSGTDIQGAGIHPDIEIDLPPSFVPVLSSDTTKVDFEAISSRLGMCQIPSSI